MSRGYAVVLIDENTEAETAVSVEDDAEVERREELEEEGQKSIITKVINNITQG